MNFFSRIVVVATVVAACLLRGKLAAFVCEEGQTSVCASCTTTGTCTADGEVVTETGICPENQVCSFANGVAACGPASGTLCECEPFSTGCDAYDPARFTVCINDESHPDNYAPVHVQTCTNDQTCFDKRCVDPTTITTTTESTTSTTPTTTTESTTTTTTKPATCTDANANTRYPYEGDCTRYYTCREVTRGSYRYVEAKCLGTTVFNAQTRYCDLPANVPGCP